MTNFCYARFSKHEQAEGTSIQRQQEDCARMAREQDWGEIDHWLKDEGKSAFHGENRSDFAELGRFINEARVGIHSGSRLIVERIDRLSRQGHKDAGDLINLLIDSGVTVATFEGREVYHPGQKIEMSKAIALVVRAELAHEESLKKSQRLTRQYEIKRVECQANGTVMTAMLPGHLIKGPDGKAKVREGAAELALAAYQMADRGIGSAKIMRFLNENYKPWPSANGAQPKFWSRSRVSRLLTDRSLTGEYQPFTKNDLGERVPAGEPWADHFPRVIEQDLFDRVQAAAKLRQSPAGQRSPIVANLFSGKLRCDDCGSPMRFSIKRKAGAIYNRRANGSHSILKNDECVIQCSKQAAGSKCPNSRTIYYYGVERAMLDACLHLALDDRAFQSDERLGAVAIRLAEKRREHQLAVEGAQAMWEAYKATKSKMAMAEAAACEEQAEALAKELAALEVEADTARGQASAEAHLSRVAEFRRHCYSDDQNARVEHRRKVQQAFASVVTSMHCQSDGSIVVTINGGLFMFKIVKGRVVNADVSLIDMAHGFDSLRNNSEPDRKAVLKRVA